MNHAAIRGLRELPSVNELLSDPTLAPLIVRHGRETVREWARAGLDALRRELAEGTSTGPADRDSLLRRAVQGVLHESQSDACQRLGSVINATGVVLHTGLGRAPLCATARAALADASRACNLEIDLSDGERRSRGYQLQSAWRRLTGCDGALVVNNNAAATMLTLAALCRGREVLIARGELIEIGGSFRLPEIFEQAGVTLREVGTTNRTRLADYERGLSAATAGILRVHPSNYRIVGFTEAPPIAELAQLARRQGVYFFDDIGSGCLVDTTQFGLPREPTFTDSLAAGADLVLGSGDKLLGGPQCGILLGKQPLLDELSMHPLARAFRVDKLTLAALTATIDVYLQGRELTEIPTYSLLGASAESLYSRAQDICRRANRVGDQGRGYALAASSVHLMIHVARDVAPVGGGALPGGLLPTALLRLTHPQMPAEELARRLRCGQPRLFGRIHQGEVVIDLRSVAPEDDDRIIDALQGLPKPSGAQMQ
ncbi:MAG: L-seryl-tRNA(Sec) selenium transferase [Planctomycetales bacterium]